MTNTYKNKYCYWCGKSCIDDGIDIKQGNSTQGNASLCSFCIKFPTVGVMYDWMGIVANYALSDKSVILNKIVYNEETGKYDVYFTYYDNEQARQGWVA